jgi:type I restriction enzyme R subunit
MNKSNFEFLKEHDEVFFQLAYSAETFFSADPNTTLIKLRQLGEALAREISARCGIAFDEKITQADLLYRLNRGINLDAGILDLFHILRIEGNKATHQFQTQHKEAINGLRVARTLAVWFHQSFGKNGTNFKSGPFITPKDPSLKLREFGTKIEQLKTQLSEANVQLENNKNLTDLIQNEKEAYEELSGQMKADTLVYEQIAQELEDSIVLQKKEFEKRIKELVSKQDSQSKSIKKVTERTQKASSHFSLNEELTRIIIDQKLNEAGWQADTQEQTFKNGSRPEKGKNKAIAEWPTIGHQSADYILFVGLIPIAVVEAKRENTNVAGKILQAERYSLGFQQTESMEPAWRAQGRTTAWPYKDSGHYQIPFVYSCNGRPYIKQLAEQSGTWFRDVREFSNLKRPIHDFHSPDGLLDKLSNVRLGNCMINLM